jgi:hypothetical protein
LLVLAVEPRLDPLRRDPRFQEILANLNFGEGAVYPPVTLQNRN